MSGEQEHWIRLGDRLFILDDMCDVIIQKDHLILHFEDFPYEYPQKSKEIIIHFTGDLAEKECQEIFDKLCELKNAIKIDLPEDVNVRPDIMKTFYGDEFNRQVSNRRNWELVQMKARHKKRLAKATAEISKLKEMYSELLEKQEK